MVEQSIADRVKRGLGDVERVTPHGDYYGVQSSSRPGVVHMVTLTHPELEEVCRCEDWRYHFERYGVGRTCRHIAAVTAYEARENARVDGTLDVWSVA